MTKKHEKLSSRQRGNIRVNLFQVAAIVLAVFVISNLRRNKEKGFIAIDD